MTKVARALRDLPAFLGHATHVNVLVVAKGPGDGETVIQRLNLHENVAREFRQVAVNGIAAGPDDPQPRRYEPGYKPDPNELLYLDLADEPDVAAMVGQVSQAVNAGQFAEEERVISRLRFYTIVVGAEASRQVVFFRSYGPKKELGRRPGFALMLQRGSYDKVTQKVFLFDDEVDCFAWGGFLFVWNVAAFERIFGYFEQLRARAAETVDAVMARVPISNGDVFKAACTEQLQMMAKIAQIARKPYLARITMADIRRTISEFGLDIKVIREGRAEKLLFESAPKKRWLILKLLDDDYLGSVLSDEKYEVNSKVALGE